VISQPLGRSRLVSVPAVASSDPADLLAVTLQLDDSDTPADVIDGLIMSAFTRGVQPFARTARLEAIRPEATLMPEGARMLRVACDSGREARLAAGDGWTVRVIVWQVGPVEVTVTAVSDEVAQAVREQAITGAAAVPEVRDGRVPIGFWHRNGRRGPCRSTRNVSAESWPDIKRNYASVAAAALGKLMAITPADLSGQLLLLYGPPGTGKTTALRALAREWLPWCETDCVLDPETLFAEPGYLLEVALGDDEDETGRWRLLLLEDCDELIGGEAKRASGQALSRLLNLTDGLLGQGRRILVAITTNEDVRTLHPAVVRPGRCLAQIEVGPFPQAEAAGWLGSADGVRSAMTLAELYARHGTAAPISSVSGASVAVGQYL
jgi:hypothetical protein